MNRLCSLKRMFVFRLTAAMLIGVAVFASRGHAGYTIDFVINPYHQGIVDSWFFDINDEGWATGYVDHIADEQWVKSAVKYRNGEFEYLYTSSSITGLTENNGYAINNHGDVIGNIENHPNFIAASGTATPIEIPGYGVFFQGGQFVPGGINDFGKVLISGYPNDLSGRPTTGEFAGIALWNNGAADFLTELDPLYPYVDPPDPADLLSGPSSSSATTYFTGLNNANQFAADVGVFEFDPGDPDDFEDDVFNQLYLNAYVYNGQDGYSLLEPPTPGAKINPIDIDESGTVLGWVDDQSLALWGVDGALLSLLPDPGVALRRSGYLDSTTVQRNNLGQIVAITDEAGGIVFYDPITDDWTDLVPVIAGLGSGSLDTIQGFNDRGQFIGLAVPPANPFGTFGYVVSPIPEPSSLWLVTLAITLSLAHRRSTPLPAETDNGPSLYIF